MQAHDHQLRFALRENLGKELTPEVAARIEAVACFNTFPVPEVSAGLTNEQRPEFFAFVNNALSGSFNASKSRVFARVTDGRIRAVVLFTSIHRYSLEMVVASDGSKEWMTRPLLRAAFGYPFLQLKKERVTARIASSNTPAIALDNALGFVHEGVQRREFGNDDCVLMGMLASGCRWIKGEPHG